ncbi:Soluble NSF attachment domain-containing protein [Phytophthora infestans]|uniref:Soluble NSF attachment domain-containing protein n=1 Tax=Phytophthora infestans TaxID=4787 RepID=A0A833VTA5_PHYIN|nr:Soluble NSF attachment domain-containing protein [Phytophthora infestans]
MSAEGKANEFLAQGEKALKKSSFFSFGSSSQRNEDASDLFEKAGNQAKRLPKHMRCARCQSRLNENSLVLPVLPASSGGSGQSEPYG